MPISLSSFFSSNKPASRNVADIQAARLNTAIKRFSKYLYFPDNGEVIKAVLAATAANYYPGNAVWLMLIAPSGGGKTTLLNTLQKLPRLHNLGSMTVPFLLGSQRDDSDTPGFLNDAIQDFGVITINEFGCVLSTHAKHMEELLNTMRQMHDGAVSRGIAGAKLLWKGKCGMIAAGASAVDVHRDVISKMGERFLYYRLKYSDDDEHKASLLAGEHHHRNPFDIQDELADVVVNCLTPVIAQPPTITLATDELHFIECCAHFAAYARTPMDRSASYQREIEETHELEFHTRIQHEMVGWFKAALSIGVDYKTACRLLKKITFHTVPLGRMRVLQLLFDELEPGEGKYFDGGLPVITRRLCRISSRHGAVLRSVKRSVEDLNVLGVLETRAISGDKRGARNGWRPSQRTWELYAEIQSFDINSPRGET